MKLATSELRKELFELGMDLCGPYGAVTDPEIAEEAGRWWKGFFVSLAATIGGGTSEIQRNVVATRVLGLPKG
jgi:alkylation response protein AidB-like acyl-CoA dehydrogenase